MGIFHDDSSSSGNNSCPWHPPYDENASENFVGSLTFYHFNEILSGAFAGFSILSALLLISLHATHLSNPGEQFKIMRITYFIILYSALSLIGVVAPRAWVYIEPWIEFYEGLALASFFLLLCEYVSPHEDRRASFFAALPVKDRKGNVKETSALNTYRRWWILIFQFPVVALIAAIITDITQAAGVYCEGSLKPHFANLWASEPDLLIVKSVSVALAVTSVLKAYGLMRQQFGHHKILVKLLAFKGIVFLGFIEQIVFSILNNNLVTDPTNKMTYADFHVGIPNLINTIQMALFSIFFHYAYTFRPYIIRDGDNAIRQGGRTVYTPKRYQGGFLGYRGLLGALNPMEVLEGLKFAFTMAGQYRSLKNQEGGYGGQYGGESHGMLRSTMRDGSRSPLPPPSPRAYQPPRQY